MREFSLGAKAALLVTSMRDGEVPDHQELAMIEIKKEEKDREVEEGIETEKDDEEEEEDEDERIDERLVEMKLSKEKEEDSLNNNSEEKDDLVLKLKSENLEEEEEEEEEEGMKGFQLKGLQGMSPVETATLLLLSRIALFNKVIQS